MALLGVPTEARGLDEAPHPLDGTLPEDHFNIFPEEDSQTEEDGVVPVALDEGQWAQAMAPLVRAMAPWAQDEDPPGQAVAPWAQDEDPPGQAVALWVQDEDLQVAREEGPQDLDRIKEAKERTVVAVVAVAGGELKISNNTLIYSFVIVFSIQLLHHLADLQKILCPSKVSPRG